MYRCPKCQEPAITKQTRRRPGTGEVCRRYHCAKPGCKHRFSTVECLVANAELSKQMGRLTDKV